MLHSPYHVSNATHAARRISPSVMRNLTRTQSRSLERRRRGRLLRPRRRRWRRRFPPRILRRPTRRPRMAIRRRRRRRLRVIALVIAEDVPRQSVALGDPQLGTASHQVRRVRGHARESGHLRRLAAETRWPFEARLRAVVARTDGEVEAGHLSARGVLAGRHPRADGWTDWRLQRFVLCNVPEALDERALP